MYIENCKATVADRCFLPDGTEVRQGDGVVELHFWNENLATLNCRKSTFGWGVRFRSGMRIDLQPLANYANQELSADTAKTFYARLVFPVGGRFHASARVAADYGFTLLQPTRTLPRKVHDFFETILIHALCWTFNPAGEGIDRALHECTAGFHART